MSISPISSVNTSSAPARNATPVVAQKGSNPAADVVLEPEYSTRAGGKTWSANIEPLADGYSATVPNLPGATTSGPSIERVEATLSDLISFFA